MRAHPPVFAGLDVGGTFLKAARLDESGRVLGRLEEPIERETTEALLSQLARAVKTLEADSPIACVGVGLPGIVDLGSGRLKSAPNLPVLNGLDLGAEIAMRT